MTPSKQAFELPTLSEHHRQVCQTLDSLPAKAMTGDIIGAPARACAAAVAVKELAALGLSIPRAVVAAADILRLGEIRCGAAEVALTPAPFTGDDLVSDDWEDRLALRCAAVAAAGAGRGPAVEANMACQQLRGRLAKVAAAELGALTDGLDRWFATNIGALSAADQIGATYSETQYRQDLARLFDRALWAVVSAGPGREISPYNNVAAWLITHKWTPQQWQQLKAATTPEMGTRKAEGGYGFEVERPAALRIAAQIGAEIKLARSFDEIRQREDDAADPDTGPRTAGRYRVIVA